MIEACSNIPENIETARLILRIPRIEDAPAISAAALETFDDLHQWTEWAKDVPSVEDTEKLIEYLRSVAPIRSDYGYYAFLQGTDTFVAAINIFAMDITVPKYGIGYWCCREFQGQGYVSEAVRALTRLGIETLRANRLEITCDVNNTASRRVAERAGYRLEATLENDRLTPDGRLRTTAVYAFLPRDVATGNE